MAQPDAAQCPVPSAKPFLARAAQFDAKEPVVGYFLRMHAVNLLMTAPRTPESKGYLLKLLDFVEAEKKRLAAQLDATDGRTAVTRVALMVFTMADDLERASAAATDKAMNLFYTASLLFEATAQFNGNKMDPICEEKHKYARYVAALMKKSLTQGVPYQSPNGGAEAAFLEGDGGAPAPPPGPPAANSGYGASPPPAAPPAQWAPAPALAPTPTSPPPVQATRPSPPPEPVKHPAQTPPPVPPPAAYAPPPPPPQQPAYTPPAAPSGPRMTGREGKAKTDRVIACEKAARQALAALQFFDEQTARAQLVKAIEALDA